MKVEQSCLLSSGFGPRMLRINRVHNDTAYAVRVGGKRVVASSAMEAMALLVKYVCGR